MSKCLHLHKNFGRLWTPNTTTWTVHACSTASAKLLQQALQQNLLQSRCWWRKFMTSTFYKNFQVCHGLGHPFFHDRQAFVHLLHSYGSISSAIWGSLLVSILCMTQPCQTSAVQQVHSSNSTLQSCIAWSLDLCCKMESMQTQHVAFDCSNMIS